MDRMLPLLQKGVRLLEETPREAAFRRANNFQDVEASLDSSYSALGHAHSRSSSSSPSPPPPESSRLKSKLSEGLAGLKKHVGPVAGKLVEDASSYLGRKNPIAQAASPSKDAVWLFDNIAYRPVDANQQQGDQRWHAEFVVGFFSKGSGKDASRLVADIAEKVGLHEMDISDAEGERRIAQRIAPFLTTPKPGKFLEVQIDSPGDDAILKLGPAGRRAVSEDIIGPLYEHGDGHVAIVRAVLEDLTPLGNMNTFFTGPEGWTVISDIDDTIKITMTASPVGILRSTFVDTPTTTLDMPAFYSHIRSTLNATFFYLSASPYCLYPFLRPFIHEYYPHGPILLRDTSWITPSGLLQTLTQGVQAYKVVRMDKIHDWIPRRKMICVGDSTQSDPEAYAEAYTKYPGWIKHIFIRKVLGLSGMEEKNSPKRFEAAFKNVPAEAWTLFEDPAGLNAAIDELKSRG